ncbi:MAG TPA: D-hexose-6-phosphate mutarotase [bacterium]|jgi:glucose-6-phosphate 1-epimerase|nr:D-hexose-6-phosphate mutarotase [bacterium]
MTQSADIPLAEGVALVHGPGGRACVKIATPLVDALVSLHGGQLLAFQAKGRGPLLWLSPAAHFKAGVAIRGGVPLCWPWFGPWRGEGAQPQHGFARLRDWTVLGATAQADGGVRLALGFDDDLETRQIWPHSFRLRLDLRLDAQLSLELSVHNPGPDAWAWSGAMHPYLRTPDLSRCRLRGWQGLEFRHNPDQSRGHDQALELPLGQALDRTYFKAPDRCALVDEAGRPLVQVEKWGAQDGVVWTPGPSPAKSPADLPPELWREFVCVEALNGADGVVLQAGETAKLGMRFIQ